MKWTINKHKNWEMENACLLIMCGGDSLEEDFSFGRIYVSVDPSCPSSQPFVISYQTVHILVQFTSFFHVIPSIKINWISPIILENLKRISSLIKKKMMGKIKKKKNRTVESFRCGSTNATCWKSRRPFLAMLSHFRWNPASKPDPHFVSPSQLGMWCDTVAI